MKERDFGNWYMEIDWHSYRIHHSGGMESHMMHVQVAGVEVSMLRTSVSALPQ